MPQHWKWRYAPISRLDCRASLAMTGFGDIVRLCLRTFRSSINSASIPQAAAPVKIHWRDRLTPGSAHRGVANANSRSARTPAHRSDLLLAWSSPRGVRQALPHPFGILESEREGIRLVGVVGAGIRFVARRLGLSCSECVRVNRTGAPLPDGDRLLRLSVALVRSPNRFESPALEPLRQRVGAARSG